MNISDELKLPCGAIIPNRIGKSAMSENMATKSHFPGKNFFYAYRQWIRGGVGLCITGNVMIDSKNLGEPYNVVIEEGLDNFRQLKRWASAADGRASHLWVQLNHPGKQTPKFLTNTPVAPSAIGFKGSLKDMFNTPRELTENEIFDIIERFAKSAEIVKHAGFQGVQIHGAHGYLVSQFLSPRHNQRTDEWGGTIENRMRFVEEVYKAIRAKVGESFPIGIKLNSADFSKGGFTHKESVLVAKRLSEIGIDLIEVSGGSYEKPVMMGAESTVKREAYFLEYAKSIKDVIACPLMVTGGFRSSDFIKEVASNDELDIIGMGRPLCLNPHFPNQLLSGEKCESEVKPLSTGIAFLDKSFPLEIIWYTMQIRRMGKGQKPDAKISVYKAILNTLVETGLAVFKKVR